MEKDLDTISANEYIDIHYQCKLHDEFSIVHYEAILFLVNPLEKTKKQIGQVQFNLYNLSYFSGADELINAADTKSGNEFITISAFTKLLTDDDFVGKLVSIYNFKIDEEYQGKKIGTYAMDQFISFWNIHDVDYLILIPAPLEDDMTKEDRKNSIISLVRFYTKFGFENIHLEEEAEPILLRNKNRII